MFVYNNKQIIINKNKLLISKIIINENILKKLPFYNGNPFNYYKSYVVDSIIIDYNKNKDKQSIISFLKSKGLI